MVYSLNGKEEKYTLSFTDQLAANNNFAASWTIFFFTARVGKTSLIMSLVSEEFPEEVNILISFLFLKCFKIIKIDLK